ncbi:TetR/AcrR family transcriptional regulator [Pseudonocardia alaniniphila]|uniref:TetR/AcrR family transcriptional regulator n=1 Tax=Pseudonocardia alaniniphila TaxID=75291 RepID=UPI001F14219E|nr:TetR/AcrR family transcriptional regulator [Pseudonocardia alaniniphila]
MGSSRSEVPARGERGAALVAVAAELFASKPYDDIYVTDIAKAAGVAHGLLFYHFKDKRGLYLEVLRRAQQEVDDLHRRREGEDSRQQWLRGVVRRHIEYRRDHAFTMLAMMRRGGQDPEVDEIFEQSRRVGTEFLCELLGLSEPPAPPVRVALRGCMGAVDEMCVDWLSHGCDLEPEELIHLAYTTVVTILSTVCSAGRELAERVDELGPSGGSVR